MPAYVANTIVYICNILPYVGMCECMYVCMHCMWHEYNLNVCARFV